MPGLKTNYFLPLLYNEKLTQKRENIDDLQTKWNSKIQKLPKSKGNKKRGIKRCKICIRHLPTFSTYHFYMLMGPNVFWKLKGTKMELQQLNCMLLFIFRDVFLHWFTSWGKNNYVKPAVLLPKVNLCVYCCISYYNNMEIIINISFVYISLLLFSINFLFLSF